MSTHPEALRLVRNYDRGIHTPNQGNLWDGIAHKGMSVEDALWVWKEIGNTDDIRQGLESVQRQAIEAAVKMAHTHLSKQTLQAMADAK